MTFTAKATAKISAKYSDSNGRITFDGTSTSNSLTPEDAKESIDKILGIVGRAVTKTGMTRTITQEATN